MKNPNFSQFLIRLSLACAILFSTFAFAFQPAAAAAPAAPAASISWTAKLVNRQIYITGSGFLKNHEFYVRVRPSVREAWVRIGKAKANNLGKIDVKLTLPKQWANAPKLTVCLKDILNNKVYCTTAKR